MMRRPTPSQGKALTMLGHAIEYLLDSALFQDIALPSQAIAILSQCSRQVFAECSPIQRRLTLLERLYILLWPEGATNPLDNATSAQNRALPPSKPTPTLVRR